MDASLPVAAEPHQQIENLGLEQLVPYARQTRKHFDPEALASLAESIRHDGVVQPIVARLRADGKYEIIAGERRWRASKLAGRKTIPAVVRVLSDTGAHVIHLIENLQKADLNLVEKCAGASDLVDTFKAEIAATPGDKRSALDLAADKIGMSKEWVSRHAGFSRLSDKTRKLVDDGHVSSIDIVYLVEEMEQLDPEYAEEVRDRFSGKSWEQPPTRKELQEDVKRAKAALERQRKAEEARQREEDKQRKALEAEAKKTGKTVEQVAAAKKVEPPKNESNYDRERRLQKEKARELAPPLRKFARELRKAIMAAMPPLDPKKKDWFAFTVGIPDHAISSNTPKNPESVQFHFELRGDTADAGRIIEALSPKQKVRVGLDVTIEQLRQIEKVDGIGPVGIKHMEYFKASGKQLAAAALAITGKPPAPVKSAAPAPAGKQASTPKKAPTKPKAKAKKKA